jgi:hypothetical protein
MFSCCFLRSHTAQMPPLRRVSGARSICLAIYLILIGLGLCTILAVPGRTATGTPAERMVLVTPPALAAPEPAVFRGAAAGAQDTPPPIPDTDLPHCVLFSILGNDFDPCNWMMRALVGAVNWFFNWIENLLQGFINGLLSHDILIDTPTSVTTQNAAIMALVDDMRWIANSALVLIALIGGFNLMARPHLGMSYHTVAEFLPRYLIGALGANLSLWMLGQLVDAGNLFMHFVGVAPFFTPQLTNLPSGANVLATVFFGTIGIICYLLMELLLILQIFVRLALLDFLIVISPLAIICWILPQTQRAAEWWAGLTTSTLVLQPLQLTMVSMGITLATNIPADGLWGFDTVLLQICILIATLYLCFRLPALLNYGLFRTIGGVGSGFGLLGSAAQIGLAMATGNPAMAAGAMNTGGGGSMGGATVTPGGTPAGPSGPGLSAPAGGSLPSANGGSGSSAFFPPAGSGPAGSYGSGSSGGGGGPSSLPPADDAPGTTTIIDTTGYTIPDDGGPLT